MRETAFIDELLFKTSVDHSKEGIGIYDKDGNFIYINSAMALMHGYDVHEVLSNSWRHLYTSDEVKKIETQISPTLENNHYWRGNLKGRRKNNDLFDVDVSLASVFDEVGKLLGTICHSQDISENTRTYSELLLQKQSYDLVVDHSPILIAYVDKNYRYKFVNKKYCEWNAVSCKDIVGLKVSDVISEKIFKTIKPKMDHALSGQEVHFESSVCNILGEKRWMDATYIPDMTVDNDVQGFYAFIIDIEDKKQETFRRQRLMEAIETGIEGFALHDRDGNFTYVNPAQANMYGYECSELIGKSWKQLYSKETIEIIEGEYFPKLIEEGRWRGELIGLKKNGDYLDVEVSLALLKDEAGNNDGLFCSCRDISERKHSQKEVYFLAYHDALTRLPNRLLFKERLEQAIIRANRRNTFVAILFIDLDLFKHINDTLGHSVGDLLLQSVAKKLKTIFRDEDTIARLSGDEFTVLLNDLKDEKSINTIMKKLLNAFSIPISVGERKLQQSISVGISIYPKDGNDVETLMKNADAAMYQVKEEGRQNYKFYKPSITDSAYENLLYRAQLQNALDEEEFQLYYQPIVSLLNHKVVAFEALIRWNHPEKGLVFPDKFIRFAEETNLIIPIGYWVIEKVCHQLKEWERVGVNVEKNAINVSGVQLQDGFKADVINILERTNTSPNKIELEITETFIMREMKKPVEQLNELRSIGFDLAIDDFGTGYSSLSQLKQLPTHCLKIDRSFVGDIVNDPDDLAIVKAIIALAKSLNLQVTAEGVETLEQHEILRRLGCDKAQGYYYSKPCPFKEIPDLYHSLNDRLSQLPK